MSTLLDNVYPYDDPESPIIYATVFNVFLAAHDAEDYQAGGGLAIGLMVLMVLIAGVILSNLVISILGNTYTYDRWQLSEAAEKLVLRAGLCQACRGSWRRKIALKLFCSKVEAKERIVWGDGMLYVLVPASQADEEQDGEWSGRLNQLMKQNKKMEERMEERMKKQNEEMKKQNEEMKKQNEEIKKQNEEIMRALKLVPF
jgi:hypothetical protein